MGEPVEKKYAPTIPDTQLIKMEQQAYWIEYLEHSLPKQRAHSKPLLLGNKKWSKSPFLG
jgi:hypothetical protein